MFANYDQKEVGRISGTGRLKLWGRKLVLRVLQNDDGTKQAQLFLDGTWRDITPAEIWENRTIYPNNFRMFLSAYFPPPA